MTPSAYWFSNPSADHQASILFLSLVVIYCSLLILFEVLETFKQTKVYQMPAVTFPSLLKQMSIIHHVLQCLLLLIVPLWFVMFLTASGVSPIQPNKTPQLVFNRQGYNGAARFSFLLGAQVSQTPQSHLHRSQTTQAGKNKNQIAASHPKKLLFVCIL